MRSILVCGLAAVLAALASAQSVDEALKKEALDVRAKCLTDAAGTEDDLKEIEEKHEVTSDFAKKMTLCVFKAFKIMDENNQFSKKTIVEMAQKAWDGKPEKDEKLKAAEEVANTCEKEVSEQGGAPEETAKAIYDCLKKNVIEKKLHADWQV